MREENVPSYADGLLALNPYEARVVATLWDPDVPGR